MSEARMRGRPFVPVVPPEEIEQLVALYRAGVPHRDIRQRLGLSRYQVYHRLVRAGEPRRAPRRPRPPVPVDPAARTPGQWLRALREASGLSRGEVARRSRVDPSHITRVEGDDRQPTRALIERLADALGCSAVERGRLYVAAGYAPEVLTTAGAATWSPALESVARTIGALEGEARTSFELQVRRLADWHRREMEGA